MELPHKLSENSSPSFIRGPRSNRCAINLCAKSIVQKTFGKQNIVNKATVARFKSGKGGVHTNFLAEREKNYELSLISIATIE